MARVQGLEKDQVRDPEIRRVLESQERNYGAVLENHAVLARRPSIFRGFRAMWEGLEQDSLLGTRMASLVNVRVAERIGCSL
jgi:hypothetical protein